MRVPRLFLLTAAAAMLVASKIGATFGRPSSATPGSSPVKLPQSLQHWWRAEGNRSDRIGDDRGRGVSIAPGVRGADQSFSFNGSGAFVRFSTEGGNFGVSDFTISFFMRTSSTGVEAV